MHLITKTLGTLAVCGLLATTAAHAETIQVNFGGPGDTTTASNWNNVEISNNSSSGDTGSTLPNLINDAGANTGITLTVERDDTTNPEIQFGGVASRSAGPRQQSSPMMSAAATPGSAAATPASAAGLTR